jgi:hypothetical protein
MALKSSCEIRAGIVAANLKGNKPGEYSQLKNRDKGVRASVSLKYIGSLCHAQDLPKRGGLVDFAQIGALYLAKKLQSLRRRRAGRDQSRSYRSVPFARLGA